MLKKYKFSFMINKSIITVLSLFICCISASAQKIYDVVVYGGTSAGVVAAVQVAKQGKTVILIEPETRLGGLTTGGLGDTDAGNEKAIGGLSRNFYKAVGVKYGENAERWKFEPKVALEVMNDWIKEFNIPVVYNQKLNLKRGVIKKGTRIVAIRMEGGKKYYGKMFIDATYEGDVMANAGISYIVGREGNAPYNETLNGIHGGDEMNELPKGIDPYKIKGNKNSGLIKRVRANNGGLRGIGDKNVQAYNFRMCLTNDSANRVTIEKPKGYDEEEYEILFRAIEKGQKRRFFKLAMVSETKTDSNNDSGISTDYIGMSNDYPEASHKKRKKIKKAHEIYQRGLVWTLQNHSRVPQEIRDFYKPWGLPKDEFTDNNNWPHQLYVRESRRMISDFVITEHVVLHKTPVTDVVGLGSYAMDSHHIQYYVNDDGEVSTEGGFYKKLKKPYPISYSAIVPKKSECTNLFVPVCVSATHAAYGSIRMEPVFMILAQSAATAASMCIDENIDVQNIDYNKLYKQLKADGQELMK